MADHKELLIREHQGMRQIFSMGDDACVQHALMPGGGEDNYREHISFAPFTAALAGRAHGGLPAIAAAQTELSREMKLKGHEITESGLKLTYFHEETGLEVCVAFSYMPDCAVVRAVTTAVNRSDKPLTLTHLSSVYLQGIALGGMRPWHDKRKIRLHYCRQSWAGEGQWRQSSLEEAGLYPTATHSDRSAFHLSSTGSWSTSQYAPMLVIEDLEASQVWYAQIETSSPWHFEVGVRGSIWEEGKRGMYLQADAASERVGGWAAELAPGESFETAPVAAGCCEGGFTEAVRELTRYRRNHLKLDMPVFGHPPVVFNDYMNCIWANPSTENLTPLIDAAAAAGAEVYCIDAGWFTGKNGQSSRNLGDWTPHPEKFGERGLGGILQYIHSKGMVPGVWLEMEVCGENAELGKKPDDWFLRLNGKRVGGGDRWFLNFTNEQVRQYLHGVIDQLASLGAGFIKNDYNACVGPGDDVLSITAADGLLRNARGFYAFIDEVRVRHPDLILENCGCGAMRLDYGIQSHFHSSSVSDQENYAWTTSIMAGTLAFMLPEQTGIWAYPFPLTIQNNGKPEVLESDEYLAQQADGEQTIYNMINALCGAVTLSGRIDKADDRNFEFIREALALYKRKRGFIETSYPCWPLGIPAIGGEDEWASVGLYNEDGDRLMLAVWRRETASTYCEIPLIGFAHTGAEVRQLYPSAAEYSVETYYNRVKGSLTVRFRKRNQARFFEIVKN